MNPQVLTRFTYEYNVVKYVLNLKLSFSFHHSNHTYATCWCLFYNYWKICTCHLIKQGDIWSLNCEYTWH